MPAQQYDVDAWERRERLVLGVVPYVSLGLATALGLLVDHGSPGRIALQLGLSGAAVAWVTWFAVLHPDRLERPRVAGAYFVVLIGLIGALISVNGMYGFAIITGYMHAFWLGPRWRALAVVVCAALGAAAQLGGIGNIDRGDLLVYLLVFAVNVLLAGGITLFAWRISEESDRRRDVIAELAEANARLEAALEENAGLHAQLLAQAREAGVHDERQRMAGEIHDTIAQGLAGVVTQLQAARQARERDGAWERHLDVAQRMARDSLAEARRSVQALRPQSLEESALPEALAEVAGRWTALHGVPAEVRTTGTVRTMHPEVEGTLLRTAQEALANVAKHAGASRVAVTLSYMGDLITLDVRDDGAGFVPDRVAPTADGGYGLTAMRRRVARVAGTLEIESEPGAGTAISASVPAVPMGDAG
ncbi:sensor histidine kinase [Actinomadura nitritigenes]|uniref:Oxygen sensor histidine kinase NreB n=1 Tax=Actinomadura nitritigenes TaxID=134602 RepID=A0ABS3QQC1_9ACTN|nr:sensor histidine kinase [Actinomadura nitritigenes]MBO2436166.1 sensor histidine kinase [Actinomadura nitritigenes]